MPETASLSKTVIVLLLAGLSVMPAHAQSASLTEHAQLNLLVRQLDMIERTAAESRLRSDEPGNRYHFDYLRLHSDIQRIRSGIHDYLTPQRAQPRDPIEITGHYTTDTTEHPDTAKGQP